MEYKTVELEDFKVIGLECEVKKNNGSISKAWQVFNERGKEIETLFNNVCYGLSYDMKNDGTFNYMACVKVEEIISIPNGMKAKAIEGGKYAVFTFKDQVSKMSEFFNALYIKHLPELNLITDNRVWLEYYDERFKINGECDIYVPIR